MLILSDRKPDVWQPYSDNLKTELIPFYRCLRFIGSTFTRVLIDASAANISRGKSASTYILREKLNLKS